MPFVPFQLERWQSTWENRVRYNLSESGVHPLSIRELLHLAARAGSADLCRLLLARGFDPVRPDALGCTPLHEAAEAGSDTAADAI